MYFAIGRSSETVLVTLNKLKIPLAHDRWSPLAHGELFGTGRALSKKAFAVATADDEGQPTFAGRHRLYLREAVLKGASPYGSFYAVCASPRERLAIDAATVAIFEDLVRRRASNCLFVGFQFPIMDIAARNVEFMPSLQSSGDDETMNVALDEAAAAAAAAVAGANHPKDYSRVTAVSYEPIPGGKRASVYIREMVHDATDVTADGNKSSPFKILVRDVFTALSATLVFAVMERYYLNGESPDAVGLEAEARDIWSVACAGIKSVVCSSFPLQGGGDGGVTLVCPVTTLKLYVPPLPGNYFFRILQKPPEAFLPETSTRARRMPDVYAKLLKDAPRLERFIDADLIPWAVGLDGVVGVLWETAGVFISAIRKDHRGGTFSNGELDAWRRFFGEVIFDCVGGCMRSGVSAWKRGTPVVCPRVLSEYFSHGGVTYGSGTSSDDDDDGIGTVDAGESITINDDDVGSLSLKNAPALFFRTAGRPPDGEASLSPAALCVILEAGWDPLRASPMLTFLHSPFAHSPNVYYRSSGRAATLPPNDGHPGAVIVDVFSNARDAYAAKAYASTDEAASRRVASRNGALNLYEIVGPTIARVDGVVPRVARLPPQMMCVSTGMAKAGRSMTINGLSEYMLFDDAQQTYRRTHNTPSADGYYVPRRGVSKFCGTTSSSSDIANSNEDDGDDAPPSAVAAAAVPRVPGVDDSHVSKRIALDRGALTLVFFLPDAHIDFKEKPKKGLPMVGDFIVRMFAEDGAALRARSDFTLPYPLKREGGAAAATVAEQPPRFKIQGRLDSTDVARAYKQTPQVAGAALSTSLRYAAKMKHGEAAADVGTFPVHAQYVIRFRSEIDAHFLLAAGNDMAMNMRFAVRAAGASTKELAYYNQLVWAPGDAPAKKAKQAATGRAARGNTSRQKASTNAASDGRGGDNTGAAGPKKRAKKYARRPSRRRRRGESAVIDVNNEDDDDDDDDDDGSGESRRADIPEQEVEAAAGASAERPASPLSSYLDAAGSGELRAADAYQVRSDPGAQLELLSPMPRMQMQDQILCLVEVRGAAYVCLFLSRDSYDAYVSAAAEERVELISGMLLVSVAYVYNNSAELIFSFDPIDVFHNTIRVIGKNYDGFSEETMSFMNLWSSVQATVAASAAADAVGEDLADRLQVQLEAMHTMRIFSAMEQSDAPPASSDVIILASTAVTVAETDAAAASHAEKHAQSMARAAAAEAAALWDWGEFMPTDYDAGNGGTAAIDVQRTYPE